MEKEIRLWPEVVTPPAVVPVVVKVPEILEPMVATAKLFADDEPAEDDLVLVEDEAMAVMDAAADDETPAVVPETKADAPKVQQFQSKKDRKKNR